MKEEMADSGLFLDR